MVAVHVLDVPMLPPEQAHEFGVVVVEPGRIQIAPPVQVIPDPIVGQQPRLAERGPRLADEGDELVMVMDDALDLGHDIVLLRVVSADRDMAHVARPRKYRSAVAPSPTAVAGSLGR